MCGIFVELPAFARYRTNYLDDEAYRLLQVQLLENPAVGAVIQGTSGLRKMRFRDSMRGTGKRGGVRVIYYWWAAGSQFCLFTIYSKDEMSDLSAGQRKVLADLLKREKAARKNDETRSV